jgi:hypothetical protein
LEKKQHEALCVVTDIHGNKVTLFKRHESSQA